MKTVASFVLVLIFVASTGAQTQMKPPREAALDRFLRYVKIDTQSQEDQQTVPSTRKQLNLATLLAKELKDMGADNVRSVNLASFMQCYREIFPTIPRCRCLALFRIWTRLRQCPGPTSMPSSIRTITEAILFYPK